MSEVLRTVAPYGFAALAATALYAVLFPDNLQNAVDDVGKLIGNPSNNLYDSPTTNSNDTIDKDSPASEKKLCSVPGCDVQGVVLLDGKLLCPGHALAEQKRFGK